jgi:hypothetical protein
MRDDLKQADLVLEGGGVKGIGLVGALTIRRHVPAQSSWTPPACERRISILIRRPRTSFSRMEQLPPTSSWRPGISMIGSTDTEQVREGCAVVGDVPTSTHHIEPMLPCDMLRHREEGSGHLAPAPPSLGLDLYPRCRGRLPRAGRSQWHPTCTGQRSPARHKDGRTRQDESGAEMSVTEEGD